MVVTFQGSLSCLKETGKYVHCVGELCEYTFQGHLKDCLSFRKSLCPAVEICGTETFFHLWDYPLSAKLLNLSSYICVRFLFY